MPIIVRPFLLSSIFPFRDQQRFAFYDIWIGYMGYKILKKSFKSSQKAYPTFFVLLNLWAVEDVDWLKEGKSAAALCFDFKIRLNNWLAHQMKFYPVLGAFFLQVLTIQYGFQVTFQFFSLNSLNPLKLLTLKWTFKSLAKCVRKLSQLKIVFKNDFFLKLQN